MPENDRASNPSLCPRFTWNSSEEISIDCHCPSCKPSEEEPVLIAVVGARGSRKTSFVDMASGSSSRFVTSLGPGTNQVQLSEEFVVGGQKVVLIDTPGFDYVIQSQGDVLRMIAAFLEARGHSTLGGFLYFHRVFEPLMDGIPTRNLGIIRQLCGTPTLENAIIVISQWDDTERDLERGKQEAKETALRIARGFNPVLEGGGRLIFYNTEKFKAHDIIRRFIPNQKLGMQIRRRHQDELGVLGAGVLGVLRDQEDRLRGKFEQKMLQRESEQETRRVQEQARVESEQDFSEVWEQMRVEMEQEVHRVQEQTRMESEQEIRRVREQMRMESEEEIRRVREQARVELEENCEVLEQVRVELEQEIRNVREQARVESEQEIRNVREQKKVELEREIRRVREQTMVASEREVREVQEQARVELEQARGELEQARVKSEQEIRKVKEQTRVELEQEIRRVREQIRMELEQEIHGVQEQARVESEQEVRRVREYTRNRGGSLFPP